MWHEARANEKRIKELMVDHKKRAERRRAYYESRLGDPRQLLRVIGSSCKLYPDAEQYYYHENTDNLMPWPVDPDIKIDRFDGRSLLDYIPGPCSNREFTTKQDKDIQDELNFERYHDLVEMERLQVEEKQRLTEVETEWTKLLDRHKALLAMLNNSGRPKTQNFHTFDYGTNDPNDNMDHEQESQLLKEADILQYVDDLTDKDRSILNDMAEKYGIQNYGRLLRMAKKDRDDDLRELQAKQGKSKERSGRRSRDASKERRRYRSDRDSPSRHDDRYYRSKDTRDESSDSDASVEDNPVQSDVVIEFSSTPTEKQESDVDKPKRVPGASSIASNSTKDSRSTTRNEPPKKLTPMEKLKLKMRQGLEKQIHSEEREKRWREREQQLDKIRSTYKKDSASSKHERESSPTPKKTRRYYSPSSSSSGSRSPSPPASKKSSDRRHRSRSRSYSPRRKSSSHRRQRYRSRSRSRDSKRSRKRSRDSRSKERYSSSRKRRYSPDDRYSSRRSSRDSRR
ncbi:hypothetical protein K492DRAFT_202857 [Lichtheimia hyalospora FSU 10163]|nr:hypothetical protein K492DRAFT_202857 [Lichtheimia hyalospora FSU 10163]